MKKELNDSAPIRREYDETAYWAGYDAFYSKTDCPYLLDTWKRACWADGWRTASKSGNSKNMTTE